MNELQQYNKLVKQYKEYYFNVYSFLTSKGWAEFEPYENTNNELAFDWLISPELYEFYQIEEDINVIDKIENDANKFDVEISNCKGIVPPTSFVCNIDVDSNIEQVISNYKDYLKDYNLKGQADIYLINNDWFVIEVEDVQACYDDSGEIEYLTLYISPDLNRDFVEAFINKNNVYDLLKHWSEFVVNSDIWWDYNDGI
jgi:hypothetical protein